MNFTFKTEIDLPGRLGVIHDVPVTVDVDVDGPDPSVGIFGVGVEITDVRYQDRCADHDCSCRRPLLDDLTPTTLAALEEKAWEELMGREEKNEPDYDLNEDD